MVHLSFFVRYPFTTQEQVRRVTLCVTMLRALFYSPVVTHLSKCMRRRPPKIYVHINQGDEHMQSFKYSNQAPIILVDRKLCDGISSHIIFVVVVWSAIRKVLVYASCFFIFMVPVFYV